jgi:pimeloyl-ACP methyl ester carboxylesterase
VESPLPDKLRKTRHRFVDVDRLKIFYREAGSDASPAVLLLHGLPTSSHMFRDLIPVLADDYHVVAPDLPGFGFSDAPARAQFKYTFDRRPIHDGDWARPLCHLRLRLRCTGGLPARDAPPGADHGDHLAKRQRL